jgi:hypothetical protein
MPIAWRAALRGAEPKSERALALAMKKTGFSKGKADGGKVHYRARVRPKLAVVT